MFLILIILISGINSNQTIFAYSFNGATHYMGYNIYQAHNPVATVFRVYGGGGLCYKPIESRKLGCLANKLLNRGITLIYLNGEDIYKNRARNRFVVAEDINITLYGITAFREWFITNLNHKYKKTILYGVSYGGGVIMKHAEMLHNTFDGYISHAGLINPEQHMDMSIGYVSDSVMYQRMLSVICSRIASPILLLHNEYDNIVPSGVSYRFYNICKYSGKKNIDLVVNKKLVIGPHSDRHWCKNSDLEKIINFGV
jgi:dienelactone hydrolase